MLFCATERAITFPGSCELFIESDKRQTGFLSSKVFGRPQESWMVVWIFLKKIGFGSSFHHSRRIFTVWLNVSCGSHFMTVTCSGYFVSAILWLRQPQCQNSKGTTGLKKIGNHCTVLFSELHEDDFLFFLLKRSFSAGKFSLARQACFPPPQQSL